MPDGTFFIEMLVMLLLIAAAVWWLVRTLRRHIVADELTRLARLRDAGIVNEDDSHAPRPSCSTSHPAIVILPERKPPQSLCASR